ncbi:MAG: ABC transporter substrate-binding protein [Paralcaligenes sp.]
MKWVRLVCYAAIFTLTAGITIPAIAAEVSEVTLAKQFGIGSLTFMVMQHDNLYEKALAAQNIGHPVSVKWVRFTGGAAMNDAILSGSLNFAMAGTGPLATMWAKTRGNMDVMGVCAANSMPMMLNTRNAAIKNLSDFSQKDRIALPGVKVSIQAILLEMAASKAFGSAHYDKLDPLTVTLSHADGMLALLSGKSEINSHFTSPPYSYLEVERPGIHTVLDSYQILGGPGTLNVVYTTSKFRAQNPKVYAAFLQAFKEATDFINAHKTQAATIYLEVSKDKSITKEQLVKILNDPNIHYTMAPERIMDVVQFMHKTGRIKIVPTTWKDMFFPEIHDLAGS